MGDESVSSRQPDGGEAMQGVEVVDDDEQEEDPWEHEALDALSRLQSIPVTEGAAASHALHFAQLNIILNRTGHLLDVFAEGLRDGLYSTSSVE